jgi:hypothetical protein
VNITPLADTSARTIFVTPMESPTRKWSNPWSIRYVYRAIGEQTGEAALARFQQAALADDVEVCFLLSSETGRGKVFRRGGAAHGKTDVLSILLTQEPISVQDLHP